MNNLGGEGGDTAHTLLMKGTIGVGTPHNIERLDLAVYRVGGWVVVVGGVVFRCLIIPLRGSILQAETCQIPSLTENPRWSQKSKIKNLRGLRNI